MGFIEGENWFWWNFGNGSGKGSIGGNWVDRGIIGSVFLNDLLYLLVFEKRVYFEVYLLVLDDYFGNIVNILGWRKYWKGWVEVCFWFFWKWFVCLFKYLVGVWIGC